MLISALDLDLIRKCCQLIQGEHDFVLFQTFNKENIGKCTRKIIEEFSVKPSPMTYPAIDSNQHAGSRNIEFYEFFIKSKSFLYNQVSTNF